MRFLKLIKEDDGKLRKVFIDSEGCIFYSGYAKDFQNMFVVGDRTIKISAQDIINEVSGNER